MKPVRKAAPKIAFAVAIFWLFMFADSVISGLLYDEPGGEALSIYMAKGIYTVFSYIFIMGFVSSALLFLHLKLTAKRSSVGKARLSLAAVILNNLLFYSANALLFMIGRDWIFSLYIAWAASVLVCVVLLFVLRYACKKQTVTIEAKGAVISNET